MKNNNLKNKQEHLFPNRGFTLIEVLTVVAILGILYSLAAVSVSYTKRRSRDTARVAHMARLQTGLNYYQAENKNFPPGTDLVLGEGTSCSGSACQVISLGGGITELGGESGDTVLELIPKNPSQGGTSYIYNQTGSGNSFSISFTLEGELRDLLGPDCIANQDTISCTGSF